MCGKTGHSPWRRLSKGFIQSRSLCLTPYRPGIYDAAASVVDACLAELRPMKEGPRPSAITLIGGLLGLSGACIGEAWPHRYSDVPGVD